MNDYLTAKEAADMLGISLPTLYAYVSRGKISSQAAGGKTRARHYRREDVVALLERKEVRRDPAVAAEQALSFGTPVLTSALTLIENGRLFYRGHDVMQLAQERPFAEVAALLWTGEFATASLFSTQVPEATWQRLEETQEILFQFPTIARLQALLPLAATIDLAAYDLTQVPQTGVRILQLLTWGVVGKRPFGTIVDSLQEAWCPEQPAARFLLNAALILCADHELNVSSFTGRCVASANSNPYAVVAAGLAALQGPKHGGHTARTAAVLREIEQPEEARTAVSSRLHRGEPLSGFGHKLYQAGDPRGRLLLKLTEERLGENTAVLRSKVLIHEVREILNQEPTIDLALVTVAQALNLPPDAPIVLFALGRTVGWLGHALEQYQRNQLIRPRAKYIGEQPTA
ncbi:MAG: citrate synthase family protein [Chloroflexota bacterium]